MGAGGFVCSGSQIVILTDHESRALLTDDWMMVDNAHLTMAI